ncbi:cyclin-dependent kinase inhibitor 3 family protein [uncultured Acinetobacter sp.]|uniref:cyclin-dependent kinase inhibitor 3 family protein n=1 Tax=uncultured Acinetobacter sp. TaxID=165433 RepID=UPI002634346B|nr:cyclin-dependent kinase inhibitor 3 family protein [uncultured Acinetobacter sp.]
MQQHPFDVLNIASLHGHLIFTPCPSTQGTTMEDALKTLHNAGTTALITLMPDAELAQNGVSSLPADCQTQGLEWFHLPVADESVPQNDFEERWAKHLPRILSLLDANSTIAIHCKGGSGRTGLIAARILMARGVPFQTAIELIQTLRPRAIRHPAHLAYLQKFTPMPAASANPL